MKEIDQNSIITLIKRKTTQDMEFFSAFWDPIAVSYDDEVERENLLNTLDQGQGHFRLRYVIEKDGIRCSTNLSTIFSSSKRNPIKKEDFEKILNGYDEYIKDSGLPAGGMIEIMKGSKKTPFPSGIISTMGIEITDRLNVPGYLSKEESLKDAPSDEQVMAIKSETKNNNGLPQRSMKVCLLTEAVRCHDGKPCMADTWMLPESESLARELAKASFREKTKSCQNINEKSEPQKVVKTTS